MNSAQFQVHTNRQNLRLDRAIRSQFPEWGRRAVQALVNAGKVRVNDRKVWRCSWKVKSGDWVEVLAVPAEKEVALSAFDDEWIVARDGALIALNKPTGLLSEPTRWNQGINLRDLATERFGPIQLMHRLDRDTSGLILLVQKMDYGRKLTKYLSTVFKTGALEKLYVAWVARPNRLAQSGCIQKRLDQHPKRRDMMAVVEKGGKYASTWYEVIKETKHAQLLHLWPKTGRTHQLRVHLAYMDAPILGDRLYGVNDRNAKVNVTRLMLHALKITLPAMDGFPDVSYHAPLPKEWQFE
ncbi:RluA family pseudouridine synthase [Chloroflexi bacterium TSY]|nr:RluA family pseudouridine synthase [Chloroflexi bacterium TSY]